MLNEEPDCSKPPEWLEKLESSRNRAPKLAHEVGSGSPCLKCLTDCKGLDLHFWRKICKNCKCTKDDHDVKDDGLDFHFNIVFGQRPFTYDQAKLKISLKSPSGNDKVEKEVQLEWVPPNASTKAAEEFVKSLPENRIPIKGSTGASHRVRQLKKQLPIHDFDPSFCHNLDDNEKKRLEEYSTNSRLNALGQGEVIIASSKQPSSQPDLVKSRLTYGALLNINSSDGLVNINNGGGVLSPSDALSEEFPPPPPELLTDDDIPEDKTLPASMNNLLLTDIKNSNVKTTPGKLNKDIFKAFDSKEDNASNLVKPFKIDQGLSEDGRMPSAMDKTGRQPEAGVKKEGEGSAAVKQSVSGVVCSHCNDIIVANDVAVIIDTKAGMKYWHPNCFVCNTCKEFLVDLIYFMKDDKIFCGRDYAKECNIPRCFACDELIFSNEYTMAEMKTYHVKHFCCFECDVSLANQQYIVKMGNPVCLPCFQMKYAKVCSSCGNKIGAHESGIDVNNTSWHANQRCFVCKHCSESLLQVKFMLKHNYPFCSKDCYLAWATAHPQEIQ